MQDIDLTSAYGDNSVVRMKHAANKILSMVIAAMSSFTQRAKLQACNKTTRVGRKNLEDNNVNTKKYYLIINN